MTFSPAFLVMATQQGARLVDRVRSRDDHHLGPRLISRAAARRLRAGIAAIEAYLRRLLFLLALQMEAGLVPDPRAYVKTHCPRAPRQGGPGLRLFVGEHDFPGIETALSPTPARGPRAAQPVDSASLLMRLEALRALTEAPLCRARRLAFHLARYRPGPLAPGMGQRGVSPRYGTEVSMLYTALGDAVVRASRMRPPPLGPRPRAGPRIRRL